jgi:two-component system, OmpR family, sensor histidine kinase KdpD
MDRGRGTGSGFSLTPGLAPANTRFGFFLAVALPVGATFLLLPFGELTLTTHALVGLCAVVVVAYFGGLWPAVLAAVLDAALINYFVTPRYGH